MTRCSPRRPRITGERGQATVEYVGMAVAVAVLLAAIGTGMHAHGPKIGNAIAQRLTQTIEKAG